MFKKDKFQSKTHIGGTAEKDIKELNPSEACKYLGREESHDIEHNDEKEKLKKEYFRRMRLLLGTELSAKNKIQLVQTILRIKF